MGRHGHGGADAGYLGIHAGKQTPDAGLDKGKGDDGSDVDKGEPMTKFVAVEHNDRVCAIRLARPDKRNAIKETENEAVSPCFAGHCRPCRRQ